MCRKGQALICARRLSPRDRGPGEDAAFTCMEGISVPPRESRAHLGSRGSPVPLDCMRPDGAWAHACCRHGECAWESDIRFKDLGQRCMWACAVCCFVPDGPEKMESKQHCIETSAAADGSQDSHQCANLDLSYPVFSCRLRACLLSMTSYLSRT